MKDWLYRLHDKLKHTQHAWLRMVAGGALTIVGTLGFLPVIGYWMIPLGLSLLAVDWPPARRAQRRLIVWWGKLRQRLRRRQSLSDDSGAPPKNER